MMDQNDTTPVFEWARILIGEELPYLFLFEVVFRTFVMFLIVLLVLRLIGKRGIKQLSVFELALIISLGSAAGDPMFYYEVGLLPAFVVFVVIICLYKGITFLSEKFERVEKFVEGVPVLMLENGCIKFDNFTRETIAHDEFFAQLRLKNVDQLGQVYKAFIETTGELSVFYFPKDEVLWGLPILPDHLDDGSIDQHPSVTGVKLVCTTCGKLAHNAETSLSPCENCGKSKWISAKNNPRVI